MSGSTSPEAETIIRQQDQINRLIGQSASQIDRVQRSLDSTYAAQQRFERAQNSINSALDRGRISQERANQLLELNTQRYNQAVTAANNLAAAQNNAGSSSRNFGGIVGQAGFQVQDFAVQVQSGTSALTALSQQGSQLLGAFGTGGAIAGAALTVGILAAQILNLSGETQKLTDLVEEQDRAYQSVLKSAKAWHSGMVEEQADLLKLQAYYQSLTTSVRQFEAARLQAETNALSRQRTALVESITGPGRGILESVQGGAPAYDALGNVTGAVLPGTGTNNTQTFAFTEALRVFREGPVTLQSIADLDGRMRALANGSSAIAARARETLERIQQARGDVVTLDRAMQQLEGQREALDNRVLPLPGERMPPEGRSAGGEQRRDEEIERVSREIIAQGEAFNWLRENAQAAFDTIIQQLDPVEAAFAKSQERLNALADAFDKAGGAISEGEFQRGVTLIEQKLRQDLDAALGRTTDNLNGLGREFGTVFTSAFDGLISGAKSFNDVLQSTEKALLRIIERQLVTKPLEAFFNSVFAGKNSDGSALTGVAGLLRSGFDYVSGAVASIFHEGGVVGQAAPGRMVPMAAFAGAPRYHTGGFAGAMPFAADEVPAVLRRGEVVLTERQQQAVRAGGGSVVVNQTIRTDDPGAFMRSRAQIARDTARGIQRGSRVT